MCLLIVDVASFLADLVIIGRSERSCICCTVSLQFPIDSDLSVARLVNVRRARLFVNETDHAGVTLHIRMELGPIRLTILCIVHAIFFEPLSFTIVT